MASFNREFKAGSEKLTLNVEIDARLRRYARWKLRGHEVQLRVPRGMSDTQIEQLIKQIIPRIVRQRKRATRQNDVDLTARAEALNRQYFDGELSWHTIRW